MANNMNPIIGRYTPEQIHSICQDIGNLSLGKEHIHLVVDKSYLTTTGTRVYRPICAPKSKTLCSRFYKPKTKRLYDTFNHTVHLFQQHRDQLNDPKYIQQNLDVLKHLENAFSTKRSLKIQAALKSLRNLIEQFPKRTPDSTILFVEKEIRQEKGFLLLTQKKIQKEMQDKEDSLTTQLQKLKNIKFSKDFLFVRIPFHLQISTWQANLSNFPHTKNVKLEASCGKIVKFHGILLRNHTSFLQNNVDYFKASSAEPYEISFDFSYEALIIFRDFLYGVFPDPQDPVLLSEIVSIFKFFGVSKEIVTLQRKLEQQIIIIKDKAKLPQIIQIAVHLHKNDLFLSSTGPFHTVLKAMSGTTCLDPVILYNDFTSILKTFPDMPDNLKIWFREKILSFLNEDDLLELDEIVNPQGKYFAIFDTFMSTLENIPNKTYKELFACGYLILWNKYRKDKKKAVEFFKQIPVKENNEVFLQLAEYYFLDGPDRNIKEAINYIKQWDNVKRYSYIMNYGFLLGKENDRSYINEIDLVIQEGRKYGENEKEAYYALQAFVDLIIYCIDNNHFELIHPSTFEFLTGVWEKNKSYLLTQPHSLKYQLLFILGNVYLKGLCGEKEDSNKAKEIFHQLRSNLERDDSKIAEILEMKERIEKLNIP